jgi:hypothetical protein
MSTYYKQELFVVLSKQEWTNIKNSFPCEIYMLVEEGRQQQIN